MKTDILSGIEGGMAISYYAKSEELVVDIKGQGAQPYRNLSDGQRNMLAMIGDLAIKATQLNPQFGDRALEETPGIVLIDELDLHLHPKWQRRVIEDLRRIFPKVQFVASTHSPFLIQTARDGELIALGKDVKNSHVGRGVEEVAEHIMGVNMPETSPRYREMIDVAKEYFRLLEQAKDADAEKMLSLKRDLDIMTEPYSDNPAYVAFLEMKRAAAGAD
jgi:predicted ATP-binding protein involved in virulence